MRCCRAGVRHSERSPFLRSYRYSRISKRSKCSHGFRDVLQELGLTQATIAIEKNFFDAALYEVFIAHILPQARGVPATPIISQLRMLKDPEEIECLKAAALVADAGMDAAARALRPGVSESEIAGEAELAMRKAGAEGWASVTPMLHQDGVPPWRMGLPPRKLSPPVMWFRFILRLWCRVTLRICAGPFSSNP